VMMSNVFTVSSGIIRSPQKAGSSAPDATSGPTIHVRVSTATMMSLPLSAVYTKLKCFRHIQTLFSFLLFTIFIFLFDENHPVN
jgi:hypothetical protein